MQLQCTVGRIRIVMPDNLQKGAARNLWVHDSHDSADTESYKRLMLKKKFCQAHSLIQRKYEE